MVLPGQDLLLTLELNAVGILLDGWWSRPSAPAGGCSKVNAGQVRVDAQRLRLSRAHQSDVLRAFRPCPVCCL